MIHNKLISLIILFSCVRLALQKPGSINGLKSFFKLVSTNANVVKETNPVKTATSVEIHNKSSKIMETEIINEKPNQPNSSFVSPKIAFAKQNRSCLEVYWTIQKGHDKMDNLT